MLLDGHWSTGHAFFEQVSTGPAADLSQWQVRHGSSYRLMFLQAATSCPITRQPVERKTGYRNRIDYNNNIIIINCLPSTNPSSELRLSITDFFFQRNQRHRFAFFSLCLFSMYTILLFIILPYYPYCISFTGLFLAVQYWQF